MLSAFYLVLFIFVMNYFFWNILVGMILDLYKDDKAKREKEKPKSDKPAF